MVTVLILVRNQSPELERTLESIRDQAFDRYRVRILDNASTDETGRVCARFDSADDRVNTRRVLTPAHPLFLLNSAVVRVETPYVALLRPGTCWETGFLARATGTLAKREAAILAYPGDGEGNDSLSGSPDTRFIRVCGSRDPSRFLSGVLRTGPLQESALLRPNGGARLLLAELALRGAFVRIDGSRSPAGRDDSSGNRACSATAPRFIPRGAPLAPRIGDSEEDAVPRTEYRELVRESGLDRVEREHCLAHLIEASSGRGHEVRAVRTRALGAASG